MQPYDEVDDGPRGGGPHRDGPRRGGSHRDASSNGGGNNGRMDPLSAVRHEFAETLIESIDTDDYPSYTQMDIAERCMTQEQRARYIGALIDKIARDDYPSVPMMQRVMRLVGR